MSWSRRLELEGCLGEVHSLCQFFGSGEGYSFGFNTGDEAVVQAIRRRDSTILDWLNAYLDVSEELGAIMDIPDNGGEVALTGYLTTEELVGWERKAQTVLDGEMGSKGDRAGAQRILDTIRQRRVKETKRGHKKALLQQRRGEFAKVRAERVLELIERSPYECSECGGSNELTVDHIIPVSKGGDDSPDNLQWLCQRCNSKKGARLEMEG